MTLHQQGQEPRVRVDLYEVEFEFYNNNERKILTKIQEYGDIKEERYIWGRDGKNRPRRDTCLIYLVISRSKVPDFKMRLTKMDQVSSYTIKYRKVSTLI